ncbi:MAG: metal-dependent transcriptional regulator [Methanoregula sp.]|jgi:DtxR family Mn-dependent transcriptional regulator|nr:metal-dependent transcriptional regulator [Methanoregula sp.]
MEPSQREDELEAVFLLIRDCQQQPSTRDLASVLKRPDEEVASDLKMLALEGDVMLGDDGTVALTPQGQELGMRVAKKHETLQCFLSEMLGMDRSSASNEACLLEHTVSDETIDRLGVYIKAPRQHRHQWRGGQEEDPCMIHCPLSALTDFKEGDDVIVSMILGQERAQRLLDLGVVPGERVRIKRKLANQALVIQVKGCDVALSPEVAASICVEPLK